MRLDDEGRPVDPVGPGLPVVRFAPGQALTEQEARGFEDAAEELGTMRGLDYALQALCPVLMVVATQPRRLGDHRANHVTQAWLNLAREIVASGRRLEVLLDGLEAAPAA